MKKFSLNLLSIVIVSILMFGMMGIACNVEASGNNTYDAQIANEEVSEIIINKSAETLTKVANSIELTAKKGEINVNAEWEVVSGKSFVKVLYLSKIVSGISTMTLKAEDNVIGIITIKATTEDGEVAYTDIFVDTTQTGEENVDDSALSDSTLYYRNNQRVNKGDILKYTRNTQGDSSYDTWNLREGKNSSSAKKGEIGIGDFVKIIEQPTESIWIKVEVLYVGGNGKKLEVGETGYIGFDSKAKLNFDKKSLDDVPANGTSEINTETSNVSNLPQTSGREILTTVMDVANKVTPFVMDALNIVWDIISNLLTNVLLGLTG